MPRRLSRELPEFDVSHVVIEGWQGRRNGTLLQLMREAGFTMLVTVDRNLVFQQNVAVSGLAVVVLHARSNRIPDLRLLMPGLREALVSAQPGKVTHVAGDV